METIIAQARLRRLGARQTGEPRRGKHPRQLHCLATRHHNLCSVQPTVEPSFILAQTRLRMLIISRRGLTADHRLSSAVPRLGPVERKSTAYAYASGG